MKANIFTIALGILLLGSVLGNAQNYALQFDGIDENVTFTTDPPWSNTAMTIEAWINTTSTNANNTIVGWDGAGGNIQFRTNNGNLLFLSWDNSTLNQVQGSTTINTGNWVHVAVVKSGSDVTLYVDGQEENTGTDSHTMNVSDMRIGSVAGLGTYFYNGKIDEVRIWNVARTQGQVQENMNIPLAGNESGLVTYYNANAGTGTVLTDNSSNSYDGTLENGVTWTNINPFPIYVNDNASGSNDGTNWTDAYTSLQDALNEASNTGADIWVAGGTYAPSYDYGLGGGSSYYHFRMVNGVTIYGGFAGDETSVTSRTDFGIGGANETILDGTGRYHIFYHPDGVGLDATALLDGFTLSGANASSTTAPHGYGGGIYNESCSPTIKNCTFQNNLARTSGGAIFNTASSPNIINSLFINNNATNFGGGAIYNHSGSSATIVNCTFSGNSSDKGGAMYNAWADPSVTNCIFWKNTATTSENEIFNQSSNPTFEYCDIEGGYTGTGNINSNPKFAGSGDYPYAIAGSSPCADAGTNTGVTEAYDIRGSGFTRTQNSTTDIGAYEYTNGTDLGGLIIYVNNVAVGDDNGTSWANAYLSLQSALDAALSGDEIWVARGTGTYKPSYDYGLNLASPNTERGYHFRMINGVSIYGGFAGNETTVASRTDFGEGGANETILSGDIGTEGNASDNCYHVFYHPNVLGLTTTALIDGFTISGANANGSSPHDMGGAMYNHTNSSAINFCTIKANSSSHGGGMYFYNSSPLITNSTFSGNSVSGYGGGLNLNGCNGVDITNCLFVSNSASARGGGIYLEYSSPFILNCTFSGNSSGTGGALYNDNSGPQSQNTIFWGNTATTSGSEIFNYNSLPTFSYCNVQGSDKNGNWDSNLGINLGNNIDSNPKFAGSGDYPYAIAGTSPCADAGTNSGVTEIYDIRGTGFSRTQNSTTDMGAYEYTDGTDPEGGIIYVNASATSGGNNGSSWSDAYLSLQSGIDAAGGGDQIWVAKETYKPEQESDGTTDTPTSYVFYFNGDGIPDIYGGFSGNETALSQRTDFAEGGANETILSGDLGGSVNCVNVLKYSAVLNTPVLNGFTISGASNGSQGAVYMWSASPIIENCTLKDNSTATVGSGGAMYISQSNPTIDNCVFHNNSAKYGGAIDVTFSAAPTIKNSVFYANTATTGGGGGALLSSGGGSTVLNCLFYNNSSGSGNGGAIWNGQGTNNYISCTITNNTNIYGGAGLYNSGGPVNIKNCVIWNNTDQNETRPDNIYNTGSAIVSYYYSNIEGSGGSSNWDNDYGVDLTNNIDEDPIFVNPTNDFRIAGISPCADAGNSVYNDESYDIRGTGFARKLDKTNGTVGTIDMGAYEYLYGTDPADVTLIWTAGASTTVWETAANWDLGIVPSAGYNVSIPDLATDPVISSTTTADCNNLTVASGATLTIQSDVNGTGSLIVGGTSTGDVAVQRYITGNSNDWHLLSSPVTNQEISGNFTDANGYDFYMFDETENLWVNRKNLAEGNSGDLPYFDVANGDINFTPAQGYLVAYADQNTNAKSFSGPLNQGTIEIPLTKTGSGDYTGSNLIGNPYPSCIDWKASSGWTRSMLRDDGEGSTGYSMYIYNQSVGNYGVFISNASSGTNGVTQYIPPMQGFFVVASSAGTLQMTEDICVHNGAGNWLKSTESINEVVKLKVTDANLHSDEVIFEFKENAAGGAPKMWSMIETAPSLWLNKNNNQYSILFASAAQKQNAYPLSFQTGVDGVCRLNIIVENIIFETILLEDKLLNVFHDLSQNQVYEFFSSVNDDANRFVLHFGVVGIEEPTSIPPSIQLWAANHTIHLLNPNNMEGKVKIINMYGQKVLETKLNREVNQQIKLDAPTGYYIVNVVTKNGVVNKKVYLK